MNGRRFYRAMLIDVQLAFETTAAMPNSILAFSCASVDVFSYRIRQVMTAVISAVTTVRQVWTRALCYTGIRLLRTVRITCMNGTEVRTANIEVVTLGVFRNPLKSVLQPEKLFAE